jgi:hypothetical protein
MKNLLLCAFALTHALAVHCMNHGLGLIIRPDGNLAYAMRPGIVTRPLLSIRTQTPFTIPVETTERTGEASSSSQTTQEKQPSAPSSPSASNTQLFAIRPAGLRLHGSQTYNSWDRISIANPYPADQGDDTWDIVTKHDAREAAIMQKTQDLLAQTQSLLPENLKSSINTDTHNSENPLADLETARELTWACLTRTDANFATSYIETLNKNFDPCKEYDPAFDPSKVYAYFAYDDQVAMREPNETFAHLVKERLQKAEEKNDEKTKWFMRQFGFMFRDPATKQTYDAYLTGGKDALEALKIPETQKEALLECFGEIVDTKEALKQLQKEAHNQNK